MGLPLFAGGLILNSYMTSGLQLISMLSFSYIDYIIFSSSLLSPLTRVSTLVPYSANLYLLLLAFAVISATLVV